MQCFLVVTLIIALSLSSDARPHHEVEVEKLRLIKFPDESFRYRPREQNDETRRILEEINKINIALGYVKKHEHHAPAVLDSNTYLYPQSSYHPSHTHYANGGSIPSSIRTTDNVQPFVSRKITHHHSLMIPQVLDEPIYYYPSPYLRLPLTDTPQKFKTSQEESSEEEIQSKKNAQKIMAISNDVTSIIEFVPRQTAENSNTQIFEENGDLSKRLLGDLRKMIEEETQIKKAKSKIEHLKKDSDVKKLIPEYILLPSKHLSENREPLRNITQQQQNKPPKPQQQQNKPPKVNDSKIKPISSKQPPLHAERGPLGLYRPRPTPTVPTTTTTMQPTKAPIKVLESMESEEEDMQGTEKYLLSDIMKGTASVNKEALREGGIIIQRLKVRKGGIAIAGPGGVATAGSGGTAIVGPGGLALTHPKSLTIAGPGARVVALPESFDLDKAILKSTPRILPPEGRVVATGPAVYYHTESDTSLPNI